MREVKILVRFFERDGVTCWQIDFDGQETIDGHLSGFNVVIDSSPETTFRRSFIVALVENAA
jgi:hypothetical protein